MYKTPDLFDIVGARVKWIKGLVQNKHWIAINFITKTWFNVTAPRDV